MALSRKSKLLIGLVMIVATAGIGYLAVRARHDLRAWDPERARKAGNPIPVRTVKAEEIQMDEAVGATAVTIPNQSATIRVIQGSVPLEVKQVYARLGSQVNAGDLIIEFRDELCQQAVKEREAGLAVAEETLVATKTLFAEKAASALDLASAKVKVETARLDLMLAQDELRGCRVASPIAGVVADVQAIAGEKTYATLDLTQVHLLDPILVQMDYPQERIDSLSLNQTAEIVFDSFSRETFTGKVVRISPVADTETRVLPVVLEVPNPENRIKAGVTAFVRIRVSRTGLAIPSAALIKSGAKAMAFRVEQERARVREVRPGQLIKNDMVEIRDGLKVGDEIVLFGNATLQDNDPVDPNWERWARRE